MELDYESEYFDRREQIEKTDQVKRFARDCRLVLVGCNRNNGSYSCTPRYGRLPYKMRQSLEGSEEKRGEGLER